MLKLLILLGVSMCLAYCSQKGILSIALTSKKKLDIPLITMITMLSLFIGLRRNYNDTYLYRRHYAIAPAVSEYLETDPEFTDNPLFYLTQSIFRHHVSENVNVFFLVIAFFSIASIVCFIRKHSNNFPFSMLIFFSVGLFVDFMGAMKQTLAIAVLTYAVTALMDKKYIKFYAIVLIATLFHAYAIFFVILPLFTKTPWTLFTYITIFGFVFILMTFESSLSAFLSAADSMGKDIAAEEIYDNTGINPLRLAVFAIPPLLSFFFQDNLNDSYTTPKSILMNLSLLSFLVMSLGIFMAANMFGRCAGYFEIGSIIMLPWIIKQVFEERTAKLISIFAGIAYIGFFIYDNSGFSSGYSAISVIDFVKTLI